ncbi:MAG: metallophosphoesterase family protein [Telluria sp.]
MLIAHLSDLHIDRRNTGNAKRLAYLLAELKGHRLDVWLLTGDLTEHGSAEEYESLQQLLPKDNPVFVLPGNHDNATGVARLFGRFAPPAKGMRTVRFEESNLNVVLIDSTILGQGYGYCSSEMLVALDGLLAKSAVPTVLAMHHPPIDAQMPVMTEYELRGSASFAECIAKHEHVIAVFAGHHHKAQFGTLARRCPVIIAPSTAPGIPVNFTADRFLAHPGDPAALLHRWHGGVLRTHLFLPVTRFEDR